jgi:hypothetical protein
MVDYKLRKCLTHQKPKGNGLVILLSHFSFFGMVKTRGGDYDKSANNPTRKKSAETAGKKPAPPSKHPASAPKPKNRVLPAKPHRRPVAPAAAAAAAAARAEGTGNTSDSSSASVGGTTTTTSSGVRPGLPRWVQKQFASDIEANGGIASFKTAEERNEQVLARLCNTNVEVYGKKGDTRRVQLRKKLYRWKKLHEEGLYAEKVLNRLGVKSAATLRDEEKRTGKKPQQGFSSSSSEQTNTRTSSRKRSAGKSNPHLSSSSSSSSSEASSQSSSGSSSRSSRSRSRSSTPEAKGGSSQLKAPPPAEIRSSQVQGPPPTEIKVPSCGKKPAKKKVSQGTRQDASAALRQTDTEMERNRNQPLPENTVTTQVDIERPEANREVLIFKAKDIPGVKDNVKYFLGYIILLPIDPRHILDDRQTEWFRARIFAESQVLLSMPAFEYTVLKNREALNRKVPHEYMADAIDHGRIEYEQDIAQRQMKHILLQFPYGHVLSASEIYERAGDDEELELSMVPVKVRHAQMGNEIVSKTYAAFTVARTDTAPYKKGRLEARDTESKGAQLLGQIQFGDEEEDVGMD